MILKQNGAREEIKEGVKTYSLPESYLKETSTDVEISVKNSKGEDEKKTISVLSHSLNKDAVGIDSEGRPQSYVHYKTETGERKTAIIENYETAQNQNGEVRFKTVEDAHRQTTVNELAELKVQNTKVNENVEKLLVIIETEREEKRILAENLEIEKQKNKTENDKETV